MYKIFTIYDSKADAFHQPFFSQTTASGIRAFEGVVNKPETPFHQHPADYTLFEIGSWNELDGTIDLHQAKVGLGTAIEFQSQQPNHSPVELVR